MMPVLGFVLLSIPYAVQLFVYRSDISNEKSNFIGKYRYRSR
jgi:hypothetical protein